MILLDKFGNAIKRSFKIPINGLKEIGISWIKSIKRQQKAHCIIKLCGMDPLCLDQPELFAQITQIIIKTIHSKNSSSSNNNNSKIRNKYKEF